MQYGGAGGSGGGSGSPGPPGADGNTILDGTIDPVSGVGVAGNFYINTTSWQIFGPKTTVWGTGTNLIGPAGSNGSNGTNGTNGTDGTDGADGLTILNGSGSPAGGLGVNGDFYVDISVWAIYGPKTGGGWGTSTSLIGPAGSNGTNGTNGTNGSPGAPGAPGSTGPAGPGLPVGGTSGQAPLKNSSTDFDISWYTLTKAMVGLSNADNVSEATILAAAATAGDIRYEFQNAHLDDIAGLSPAANDFLQFVSGHYATKTPAQVKTSLAYTAADVGADPVMTMVAVNSTHTMAANEIALVDCSSASVNVTLVTAPVVGTRQTIKMVLQGAVADVVNVICGGSDVINVSGGATTATIRRVNQTVTYQYETGGIWVVISTDPALPPIQFYGDGSDGNVTISGTTTLARDMYYNNLAVTGTLNTANFRVFVAGTFSGNGTVQNNGAGVFSVGLVPAGPAGAIAAGAGAAGKTSAGAGTTPAGATFGLGGAGGAGGTSGANAGGAGAVTTGTEVQGGTGALRDPYNAGLGRRNSASLSYGGGSGGGSGGITTGTQTGTDGAGGQGGGNIAISTRLCTFSGAITASGANGSTAAATTGGGGGGGGGGTIVVVTSSVTQTFTTSAAGGSGGSGTGGSSNGSSGSVGLVKVFTGAL